MWGWAFFVEVIDFYLVTSFSLLEITQIVVLLHFYFWNFVRLSDLEKKWMFFCGGDGKSGVCQSISSSISNVIGKNNLPDKSLLLQKIQIFSFIEGKIRSKIFSFFVVWNFGRYHYTRSLYLLFIVVWLCKKGSFDKRKLKNRRVQFW